MDSLKQAKIVPPENRFRKNITQLSETLATIIGELQDDGHTFVPPIIIQLITTFLENFDAHTLIRNFIYYSGEHWGMIKKRNEDFFFDHADNIFRDLGDYVPNAQKHINTFKSLFAAKDDNDDFLVVQDDRNLIWEYFDSMIKISIKYVHIFKNPTWKVKNGKTIRGYNAKYAKNTEFLSNIKASKHAIIWEIELKWPSTAGHNKTVTMISEKSKSSHQQNPGSPSSHVNGKISLKSDSRLQGQQQKIQTELSPHEKNTDSGISSIKMTSIQVVPGLSYVDENKTKTIST